MSVSRKFVCRICGSDDVKQYDVKEMMFGWKHTFNYMECMACGCLQIEKYIDTIAQYYPEDYYSFNAVKLDKYKTVGFKAHLKRFLISANQLYFGNTLTGILGDRMQPRYDKFEYLKIVNPKLNASILDIGCGNGSQLLELHKIGFTKLTGVDKYIAKSDVLLDRIKILKCDLEDLKEQYDLITLHHVFEHMSDPLLELRKIKQLLKKDGKIVIRIPVKAKAWELYKEDWVQIDAPRHYYIYSTQSLERVVNDAGLVLKQVVFDSTSFQFWASEQYKKGISLFRNDQSYNANKAMFDDDTMNSWNTLAAELNKNNQGDQAIFIIQLK